LKTHAIIFGISGFKLNLKEINFFKKYKPWGIILFSRNINNLDQVRNLTCSIRELFKDKNFPILIDQEGGKVNRFRKIINLDKYNAKYFGDIYKNNNIFYLEFNKFLKINISILKYCGININTVPVLDLFNEDKNSVIGNRAFSKKYNVVIKLSKYLINFYKNSGLEIVTKHIPGHGCTNIDSHYHLPKVNFSSKNIIHGIIRKYIKFRGILMSDDICMKALSGGIVKNAKLSLDAGCNLLLHCSGKMDEMKKLSLVVPEIDNFTYRITQKVKANFNKFN